MRTLLNDIVVYVYYMYIYTQIVATPIHLLNKNSSIRMHSFIIIIIIIIILNACIIVLLLF